MLSSPNAADGNDIFLYFTKMSVAASFFFIVFQTRNNNTDKTVVTSFEKRSVLNARNFIGKYYFDFGW